MAPMLQGSGRLDSVTQPPGSPRPAGGLQSVEQNLWPRLLWGCVLIGVLARVYGYLTAGSLWLDELFLVNNLRELSFGELLQPLRYGQNAPVGWLWLMKAWLLAFGDSEASLRVPGLIAGCGALIVVARLARATVGVRWALVPTAWLAFSPYVVWQALQAKQYSFDLLVSAVALAWATRASREPRARELRWFAGFGCLAIFVSMPSIFVLIAVALAASLAAWNRGTRRFEDRWLGVLMLWWGIFALNYLLFLKPGSQAPWLFDFWSPGLFSESGSFGWPAGVLIHAFEDPLGLQLRTLLDGPSWLLAAPAAAMVVLALIGFFAPRARLPEPSVRLRSIVRWAFVFTISASIFGYYPFWIRLVLFLAPGLALSVVLGAMVLARTHLLAARGAAVLLGGVTALPVLWCSFWVSGGGLPLAAESSRMFEIVRDVVPSDQPLLIEHIATHARRYYGDPEREVMEVPSAWTDAERPVAIRQVLNGLADTGETEAWLLTTQVGRTQGDRSTLQHPFARFVAAQTGWLPAAKLEGAIPPPWGIVERIERYGTSLWRLRRRR